jgi:hypothetical protein
MKTQSELEAMAREWLVGQGLVPFPRRLTMLVRLLDRLQFEVTGPSQ